LPEAGDADTFLQNRHALDSHTGAARSRSAELQNAITDETVLLRQSKSQHSEVRQEIESLRKRRSNIPASILGIRENLCQALRLDEADLPFAGELIEVREEERTWKVPLSGYCTIMPCLCSSRTIITQVSPNGWIVHTFVAA